ncbi:MAG: helix-turn-helix transcriptional regulator [Burkholderiales bacterium]|jgi:DNA-binding CsgD family transcriptional regulator|nr:helix-turn-helix transcriptional regulator [Burkholderiales bacterium]
MLTAIEKRQYINDILLPNFKHILKNNVHAALFDDELRLKICTDLSARSVGFKSWQEIENTSYLDCHNKDLMEKVFGKFYSEQNRPLLILHAQRIIQLQRHVFKTGAIIYFVDLLPYNNMFTSFMVTFLPIYHHSGEIIALQSVAIENKFFNFQDYLYNNGIFKPKTSAIKLTQREDEVIFLLANSITQEKIGQLLKISRSTVANCINQLCLKFDIAGSNTRRLGELATQYGYHTSVPKSLWRPNIIILDEEIAKLVTAAIEQ